MSGCRLERLRPPLAHQLPARLVEPLVLALGSARIELLLGALERLAVCVQLERPLPRQRTNSAKTSAVNGDESSFTTSPSPAREHRLQELHREPTHRRLELRTLSSASAAFSGRR